ncbi:TatD family hydrolase [Ammoniphilus sp. CFH 90114]|uniref:TatD family hydrolase n=1 Tax=Ammoniphilus sp. CFH 90114 TaxID=2493665 RepID=UPI00100F5EBE|nr:TatD family hydrolase [Ammoniphilus sp. CFH 90114]RXT04108.1 TatD family deoxyribonuclease [Ammoniphilus sp. CFH 90114]
MYFDAHIHLDQYDTDRLESSIESWRSHGVRGVLAVSTDLKSSYTTLELKAKYPDFVYAAVGYHPELALPKEQELYEFAALVEKERRNISAIGEVGLPHYQFYGIKEQPSLAPYVEILRYFSQLAVQHQLPILLHAVHDKAELALRIIQAQQVKLAHFHWLKAPPQVTRLIVEAGYYISVTPEVCYRPRDQELLNQIPLSQLLLETDGPWKYDPPFHNLATTPLLLQDVANKVSDLYQRPLEDVLEACWRNAQCLLQIHR